MPTGKSLVISCAGIGSRLGLGTTKALIPICGKSIIRRHLEAFADIPDIRVVVGFQAHDVIAEVRKYRPDAVFVFNHNYFGTKTGMSYHLGARHGNELAIELDGDLLIHPDDARRLLHEDGEWIAYADKTSEDAVYLTVNVAGEVVGFSRRGGDFEWTGPCQMRREHVTKNDGNVFDILMPHLPMRGIRIRACDIDTYGDYERAIAFVQTFESGDGHYDD